ncbi:MAG TPA: helix-turn-helix domain-containing protein [Bryobacteraceae bacterium]|jgi:excisionase family DNA binding protein|nr:helix-turn-helix domain-containing protein [Bryobacteraceae bacterium]
MVESYWTSRTRLSVKDIAERLDIGKMAVYAMLESGALPGILVGKRWLVTRYAYEQWERTCGMVRDAKNAVTAPAAMN